MESREFEALKETLNQLIPLVRFLEISYADFVNKVRSYKLIILKQIYEVEGFYYKDNLPKTVSLVPRITSTITYNHFSQLD